MHLLELRELITTFKKMMLLVGMWNNWNYDTLLVRVEITTSSLESHFLVSTKAEPIYTLLPNNTKMHTCSHQKTYT